MLIHLSSELKNVLENEIKNTDAVVQALQNLAQSRYQGDHIITTDNNVLSPIISSEILNQNTRRVFSKINSEQAQIGSLRNQLSVYVEISYIRGEIKITEENNIRVIKIPLVRFERNDIIQPTFFITENLLDCKFYMAMTSWFCKKHLAGKLPSKLNAVYCPGGGDTTEKLLNHHSLSQRYLTLCITDSDQKYPGSGFGETTKKCRKLRLNEISQHVTLPVRSIENLISHPQIITVINRDNGRKSLNSHALRLKPLIGSEAWKHLHLKEGVREVYGPHQPETENFYWQSVAISEGSMEASVDEYLFPPISTKLLLWVVEHLEKNEPDEFTSDRQLFNIWIDLTKLIASWTCASEPIRV